MRVEVRDGAGFGEHALRKDARQLVLANHHLHVDAKIIRGPEDFDNAADGGTRGRGPTSDLDIDDQAVDTRWALRAFRFWTRECLATEDAMRRGRRGGWRDLLAGRDDNGLRHALVEGKDDVLILAATGICAMKCSNDGWVAALENPCNAARDAPVGFGRVDLDQNLVALHGAAHLTGRYENVVGFRCTLRGRLAIRAHESVAVAVQIETAGEQFTAGARARRGVGKAPELAIELHKLAAQGEAGQLLEEKPALAAATKAQFAD